MAELHTGPCESSRAHAVLPRGILMAAAPPFPPTDLACTLMPRSGCRLQAPDLSSKAAEKPGVLGLSKWPVDHAVTLQHAQDFEDQPVPAERAPLAAVRYNARVRRPVPGLKCLAPEQSCSAWQWTASDLTTGGRLPPGTDWHCRPA